MKLMRLIRHLATTRFSTRRHFSPPVRAAIEQAIRECEARHGALQLFGQLGVWDTAENNGVLIYVAVADRVVEIIADRGIAARVTPAEWATVCRQMEHHYREGRFREGSIVGILGVGALLGRHFPGKPHGGEQLPDQAVLL
jgi:uncharacterized membrane protein